MQGLVNAFSKEDAVYVTVALEQLHAGDLFEGTVHLIGSAGGGAVDTKDADVKLALRFPFLKNLQHIAVAAGNADGGEAGAIHVVEQGTAAGLELVRRYLGESGGDRARGCDVALDHARGISVSVAQDGAFDEVGRVGRVRSDPKGLQSLTVQKNFIVRFLQRDGIVGGDLV